LNKKQLSAVLRICVATALLALLLVNIDLGELAASFAQVSLLTWCLCLALNLFSVYISSVKLAVLLRALGIIIPVGPTFRIYLVGIFWGNFLPGTVGGDVVKFAFLQRYAASRADVAVALIAERFLGLLAVMQIASIGVLVYRDFLNNGWLVWGTLLINLVTLGLVAVVYLLRWKTTTASEAPISKVKHLLKRLATALHTLRENPRALIIGLFISFAFVFNVVLITQLFALDLNQEIGLFHLATMVALIQLITMLPISLNGIGVREWAHIYLLGLYGVAPEPAVAISLLIYFIVLAVSLVGGLFFFFGAYGAPPTSDASLTDPKSSDLK